MQDSDVKIIIKKGKELTKDELQLINNARKREFNSKSKINPQPENEHWEKKYFLLKDKNNSLLAFARLHNVDVEFMKKRYPALGLATLIAIEKGKGFGKKLVTYIRKYIENSKITGIGFCNKKLTNYYRKTGFGIIENATLRTLYKDPKGNLHHDKWGGGDVIYVQGKDELIKEITSNPNENIFIFRPHW